MSYYNLYYLLTVKINFIFNILDIHIFFCELLLHVIFQFSFGVFTFFLNDSNDLLTLQMLTLFSHVCCKYFKGKYFLQPLFFLSGSRFLNASVSTCMKCPVKFLESLPGHMLTALVLTCQKQCGSFSPAFATICVCP